MKKILSYLKPYSGLVLLIFLLVSVVAAGQLFLPDYMAKIIGEGIKAEFRLTTDPASGAYTLVPQSVCEAAGSMCTVVQTSDMAIILKYGGIMLAVTLVSSISAIILAYVSSHIGSHVGKDIRRDLYKKVSSFSASETETFGISTLITRTTNDVMQVQNFLLMALRMLLRIPILLVGATILSIKNIREMTSSNELLYVLLTGVVLLVIMVAITFILVLPLFKSMQKRIDNLTLVTRESINGVRVVRAFGQGKREVKRFRKANDELTDTVIKSGKVMATLNPAVNLVFNLVVVALLYFFFRLVTGSSFSNYQSLGNISAVIQYSTQIMFSLLMLTFSFIIFPRAQVSAKRISEVLAKDIVVKDNGNPEYDDMDIKGDIVFDDVCFRYGDAELNVLDNISFEAKPGTTVAIIGSTGSGKSTIINLLPRLHDITCGKITIDGIDIRDLTLKKLRSLIGFVPQTATLLAGTVRQNIAYGKADATIEEIAEAAKIAQAEEFIEAMDLKYDAVIDQGGVNFSGGQKQRISIARALVRKPKIYIFDDSFSALDFKTDANLRQALSKVVGDSTVLLVAQRIGTIMDADQIIVLHDGHIVGKGTHKELLESCKVYQEIAYSQLTEAELA